MQQSAGGHNAHFLLPFSRGMRTQRPTHTKWIGTKHATVLFLFEEKAGCGESVPNDVAPRTISNICSSFRFSTATSDAENSLYKTQ